MIDPAFHLFSNGPRPVAPFSHAVETDGWVILTGQMPTDPDAPDAPLPQGVVAQTERVMKNLALILGELGLDLSHIVQCRCYLTAFERDYDAFNESYASHFPADRRPARTTVGVTALAVGALVEIDCIARRPASVDATAQDSAQAVLASPVPALDLTVFGLSDLTNIILQRSEILFDVESYGRIIKAWENGNARPMNRIVTQKGLELATRAVAQNEREFQDIRPVLEEIAPGSVADIGCGYAFFDLFVHRAFGSDLLLVDIEQNDHRHFGFKSEGAAYANLSVARDFLAANGVAPEKIQTWNPGREEPQERVPVDLAISLLSCGFHYPVDMYMPFFKHGVKKDGAVILDLRPRHFEKESAVLGTLGSVEVIESRDDRRRVLLRKGAQG